MADRHRRGEAVAVVTAAVLTLAACGTQSEEDPSLSIGPTGPTEDATGTEAPGDPAATTPPSGDTAAATDPAGTSGPTATGAAPTTTEESPGEAGTEDSSGALPPFEETVQAQDPTGEAQLLVDEIRVGLQDGFDRVVLDLSGTGEVGWRVGYVDDPALDGSGIPVDLAGDAVLQVTAIGMAYPAPGDTTYDEPLLVDGGDLATVTEVLRASPFEGQVDVFVGASERTPFRVFRLSDPERLVIDVQHPPA